MTVYSHVYMTVYSHVHMTVYNHACLQFYTDKTHSLSGKHTGIHLYELIADFLTESFGLKT